MEVRFGWGRNRVIILESRAAPRKTRCWLGMGEHFSLFTKKPSFSSRITTWAKIFCSTLRCWWSNNMSSMYIKTPWTAALPVLASASLWMPAELRTGQREGTETRMFCPDRWTSATSCGNAELGLRNTHPLGLVSSWSIPAAWKISLLAVPPSWKTPSPRTGLKHDGWC